MKSLACFKHINWNPDRAELRRFAVSMFVGFAIIAAMAGLRTGTFLGASFILAAVGTALAVVSFLPGLGRVAYLAVYLPTSVIGWVISHVLMAAVFYGVFSVLATIMKVTGTDPLMARLPAGKTNWKPAETPASAESYYRQY